MATAIANSYFTKVNTSHRTNENIVSVGTAWCTSRLQ